MKNDQALNFLHQAMRAEIGLLLKTNDSSRARQKFHRVRAQQADPFLNLLQFGIVDSNLLMIYKPQPPDTSQEGLVSDE